MSVAAELEQRLSSISMGDLEKGHTVVFPPSKQGVCGSAGSAGGIN